MADCPSKQRSKICTTSAMPGAVDRQQFCSHGRRCSVQQSPQQLLHGQNQGEVRLPHLQVSRCSCLYPRQEKVEAHLAGRIRKVTCDEGRPACRRCVSTCRPCSSWHQLRPDTASYSAGQGPGSRISPISARISSTSAPMSSRNLTISNSPRPAASARRMNP